MTISDPQALKRCLNGGAFLFVKVCKVYTDYTLLYMVCTHVKAAPRLQSSGFVHKKSVHSKNTAHSRLTMTASRQKKSVYTFLRIFLAVSRATIGIEVCTQRVQKCANVCKVCTL